jgi:sugar fermentation stimulation protein A
VLLPQLIPAVLIRRYKRFLADVELADGTQVTVHCPNSGSMAGCAVPGSRVFLSRSPNLKRKYCFTWELVEADDHWVGINTGLPNRLAWEAIEAGVVAELQGYDQIRQEVAYGSNSRIDLLLSGKKGLCYVELKNVTLVEGSKALFPDAVTTRGQKHLRELMQVVAAGHRGVTLFMVQRQDAVSMSPADAIDPVYGQLLRRAAESGVELLAYQALVTPAEIRVTHAIPIHL